MLTVHIFAGVVILFTSLIACDQRVTDRHPTPEEIIRWLSLTDASSPEELFFPQRLGPEAVPTFKHILQNSNEFTANQVERALDLVASESVKFGQAGTELIPVVEPYLLDEDPSVRATAVLALVKLGGSDQVPVLVTFLYDPHPYGRVAAIESLGKVGDRSALLSLQIWHARTQQADEQRTLQEKWLHPSLEESYQESLQQIRERVEATNERDDSPADPDKD